MSSQPQVNTDAPWSQEAEQATLGSLLLAPDRFSQVQAIIRQPNTFFLLRHQYIWRAMERLHERGEPIDHITLSEELASVGYLDDIGGRAYLIQLLNNTGTAAYATVYAELVNRTAIRRQLLSAADDIQSYARDENADIDAVIGKVEDRLFDITHSSGGVDAPVPMWEALSDYYDHVERLLQNPDDALGIPSGFRDLDVMLGGFKGGQSIIVAGRPGMGKSAWALSAVCNMAKLGVRILVCTLEMTVRDLVMRMVSVESGIPMQNLDRAELTPHQASIFTEVVGRMSNWYVFLYDKPGLSPTQMRLQANRIKYQYGLDGIVVDYAQLMTGDGYDRRTEMGDVSRSMKETAKNLNVPIITLAQLNRNLESRKDKRPVMSDLKESGDFEQDADIIMFLYRDEVYNPATEFPNQADIIVAKHRNGPTGTVSLYFEKTLTKFMNASVHKIDVSDLEQI